MKFLNTLKINKKKSVNEIIDEIHESFYTEVDRLLEYANVTKSTESQKQELLDKAQRLRNLGFSNSKPSTEAIEEEQRILEIKKENGIKENLKEAILYFSQKYPQYKFITQESVSKICDKYNLISGSVENYIGDVPEENLRHIENFKIKEEDECFYIDRRERYSIGRGEKYTFGEISFCNKSRELEFKDRLKNRLRSHYDFGESLPTSGKCSLEIAAPIKDFNTFGMELDGNTLRTKAREIPDPVVLKPVIFKNQKYYLIVTAWGQESFDELVVNGKLN